MSKENKSNVWFGATEEELRSGIIDDWAIYQRDLRKLEEMNAGALYAAEVAREEGLQQGREEGRQEGREEGIRQIIRQFYTGGFTCETIADTLCLPLSEIKKILGI